MVLHMLGASRATHTHYTVSLGTVYPFASFAYATGLNGELCKNYASFFRHLWYFDRILVQAVDRIAFIEEYKEKCIPNEPREHGFPSSVIYNFLQFWEKILLKLASIFDSAHWVMVCRTFKPNPRGQEAFSPSSLTNPSTTKTTGRKQCNRLNKENWVTSHKKGISAETRFGYSTVYRVHWSPLLPGGRGRGNLIRGSWLSRSQKKEINVWRKRIIDKYFVFIFTVLTKQISIWFNFRKYTKFRFCCWHSLRR